MLIENHRWFQYGLVYPNYQSIYLTNNACSILFLSWETSATSLFSRPNVAHVCVEVDLLKLLPTWVWVDMGDGNGF